MSTVPKTVLLSMTEVDIAFDLERLNLAMDVVLASRSLRQAARTLGAEHGFTRADAVEYVNAAQHCMDQGIDPNELA